MNAESNAVTETTETMGWVRTIQSYANPTRDQILSLLPLDDPASQPCRITVETWVKK